MNTAPDPTPSTAIAATGPTKAAAAPRIKLLSHGYSIDHPDPELGEQAPHQAKGVAGTTKHSKRQPSRHEDGAARWV